MSANESLLAPTEPLSDHDLAYALAPMLALWDAEAKRARRSRLEGPDALSMRRSFAARAAEDVSPRATRWARGEIERGLARGERRFGRWPLRELLRFQKARIRRAVTTAR